MKLMFIFVGITTVLFVIGTGIYIAFSNRYIEPWIAKQQGRDPATGKPLPAPAVSPAPVHPAAPSAASDGEPPRA